MEVYMKKIKKLISPLLLMCITSLLIGCSAFNHLFNSSSERKPLQVGVNTALFISGDFSNNLWTTQNIGENTDYKSANRISPYITFNGWKDESGISFEQVITPNLNTASTVKINFSSLLINLSDTNNIYLIKTKENQYVKIKFIENPQLITENQTVITDIIQNGNPYLMIWAYNPNGELFFQENQIELFKDGLSLGVTNNTNLTECIQYILGKYL